MSIRPDVSVIVPCYGGEAFIGDAIESVLSQAGGAVEVIVVDDASPDESVARLERLNDDRVRMVRHPTNRGIAAARNSGLDVARADLVAFLDQDDLWLPGRLALQLDAFRTHAGDNVGLVFGDVVIRFPDGRDWTPRLRVPPDAHRLSASALLALLIAGQFPPLGAVLVRRAMLEAAGRFDETIRGGSDDLDIMVRFAERGRFARVPRPVFVRRVHGENYSSAERMTNEALAIIDAVASRHPEIHRATRAARGRQYYRRATERYFAGDRARAAKDYRCATNTWPWSVRAWTGRLLCGLGPAGEALVRAWARRRGIDGP
jgi:glycosyltransferase involved in cell wall biosynthesis